MCRIINYRSTESIIYNLKEFQYVYFNSLYLVDQNMVTSWLLLIKVVNGLDHAMT